MQLLRKESIEQAIKESPSPHRVQKRVRAIKGLLFKGDEVRVSWDLVSGSRESGDGVIYLDDHEENQQRLL